MFKFLMLTTALLFASPVKGPPIKGSPEPECKTVTLDYVKNDARVKFPGSRITEISGSEIISFLVGFNAIKPITAVVADFGLIIDKSGAPAVTIVLFNAGCYSSMVFLRRSEFNELIGQMT